MSYLYPYGDTQQLNLSWFLAKFKELYEYISNLDPDDIALATVLSRFTNEYNSSTNYIPGDYVMHEGFIYKANQSTTGNFKPEAWDAALPVNDIQGLRILLGGISTDLTDLEQNAVTNLQYTPGAASADGLLRQTKNGAAETVMTVDKEPTANSQNPVKSGAVQAGIAAVSQAVGSERTDRQNADTSLQNQIDDLNGSLKSIQQHKRKVLFVGDSYGAQANSWVTFAAQYLGLTSEEYVNGSVSGIGFTVDSNGNIGADYNGFADAVAAITADRDSYTDVVICGGINDSQYDRLQSSFLVQHIKNVITYVKQNFINANVRIGFIGGALDNSPVLNGRTYERQQMAKYAYISIGSPYYLNGVENAIHQSIYAYSNDKLHPSATGAEMIGQAVATAIETGYATIMQPDNSFTLTPPANSAIQNQSNTISYKNDTAIIIFNNVFSATFTSGNFDVTNGMVFTFDKLYVNKKAILSGATYMSVDGAGANLYSFRAELYQNTLSIFPLQLANNRWQSVAVRTLGFSQPLVFNIPSAWIN